MKLLLSTRRSFPAFVGSGTSISRMPFPRVYVRQRQVFYTNIKQIKRDGRKKEGEHFLTKMECMYLSDTTLFVGRVM